MDEARLFLDLSQLIYHRLRSEKHAVIYSFNDSFVFMKEVGQKNFYLQFRKALYKTATTLLRPPRQILITNPKLLSKNYFHSTQNNQNDVQKQPKILISKTSSINNLKCELKAIDK
ncbi:hypothetical protein LOAG_02016 [Loa loa]|uniref:Uncharacterized protein n=1 Tax=Loa loa TaxID=7209 RepID=A0A1S0U9L2_LOALO|nr:hypothetical protein LOAG_02016 [Loa loa]EFO26467.1 hypothetical protein LOAG_02016 [Loa loa]